MAADDQATGWTVRPLANHPAEVLAVVAGTYRGEAVAVSAGTDGHIRFWSLADGTQRLNLESGPPGELGRANPTSLATDLETLYVGWSDGRMSFLVDDETGGATPSTPAHARGSWVTALLPLEIDEQAHVFSAGTDGTVLLWSRDADGSWSSATLHDGGFGVLDLAVARQDGRYVLNASTALGTIGRWPIVPGHRTGPLPSIDLPWWKETSETRLGIRGGQQATDPVLLVTDHDRIREIDFRSGKVRDTLDGGVGEITALHSLPGGPTVVGGEDGRVSVVGNPLTPIAVVGTRVAAISSHGRTLIVGDANGGVHLVEPGERSVDGESVTQSATKPAAPVTVTPVGPVVSDRVELQDDVPGETYRDDRLRRMPLAEALAVRLERRHEEGRERSFLVHLDGPWGSGKTTVLNFVADSLGPGWTIVRYNAWRQSRIGPHWWTLLTALRDEILRRRSPLGRASLWLREMTLQRIGRSSGWSATLFVLLAALGMFLLIRPDGTTAAEVLTTFEGVAATGVAVATLVAGAQFVGRFFGWHSPRGARAFQDLDTNPMDRVAQHFSWLVHQERKRPIALFVDDLDRCPAADVVELLESVQTLVRDAGDERGESHDSLSPCVVVAGDGAWIRNAFEEHYREFAGQIAEPGRPLGYLFLAKIFQLTLPVPRIGPVRQAAYFRELLGLRDPDGADPATSPAEVDAAEARVAAAPDDDAQQRVLADLPAPVREAVAPAAVRRQTEAVFASATEHRLTGFAELLPDNPRAVKRFLNAFALTRTVRTIEGQAIPTGTLALWTILQIRWPQLADALTLHPDWVDADADADAESIPAQVRDLLADPSVQAVLRFPDGGPLTSALIHACRGG